MKGYPFKHVKLCDMDSYSIDSLAAVQKEIHSWISIELNNLEPALRSIPKEEYAGHKRLILDYFEDFYTLELVQLNQKPHVYLTAIQVPAVELEIDQPNTAVPGVCLSYPILFRCKSPAVVGLVKNYLRQEMRLSFSKLDIQLPLFSTAVWRGAVTHYDRAVNHLCDRVRSLEQRIKMLVLDRRPLLEEGIANCMEQRQLAS